LEEAAILLEKVQTYSENTKADKVKEGEQCE
jgi:hypothetical protein